jgi:hypothetical protein
VNFNNSNGTGTVSSPTTYPLSSLNYLRFTGTYTLNPDCSGTMTLTNVGTSTGSTGTTGTSTSSGSLTLNFVLDLATNPIQIKFSQSSGSQIINGYGILQ